MLIRLALLWLSMTVPATLAVAIGGPVGLLPHVVFHPVYVILLIVTILLALRLRRWLALRSARVLAMIVAVTSLIAIVGQVGEEVIVLQHGGMAAPDHLLEEPSHLGWAIVGMLGGLFPANFAAGALSGLYLKIGATDRTTAALAARKLLDESESAAGRWTTGRGGRDDP